MVWISTYIHINVWYNDSSVSPIQRRVSYRIHGMGGNYLPNKTIDVFS